VSLLFKSRSPDKNRARMHSPKEKKRAVNRVASIWPLVNYALIKTYFGTRAAGKGVGCVLNYAAAVIERRGEAQRRRLALKFLSFAF
jgi:hypothetical protein